MTSYSLLCLGDSYTIGEGLPLYEGFPYQSVRRLRAAGQPFQAPEIIAKTGWTTDELEDAIGRASLLPSYDFVSLLIGVNNEYRGRALQEYGQDFARLLQKAVLFAGGDPDHVFVLSIPDWGVSPFAGHHLPDERGRDSEAVAREIDAFNALAAGIAADHGVRFIDITDHSRQAAGAEAFAADGLHPSSIQYQHWAERLTTAIGESMAQ